MHPDSLATSLAHRCLDLLKARADSVPIVAISGCLLGELVRYDGGHKSLAERRQPLREFLQVISVCPEMAAGMGVPRPPVHWVETAKGEQLQQLDDSQKHFHQPLQEACESWLSQQPQLDACILKARSPSCGSGTTPIVNSNDQWLRNGDGQLVRILREQRRSLLIVDESRLTTASDGYWLIALLYLKRRSAGLKIKEISEESEWDRLLDWPEDRRNQCYKQVLQLNR